MLHGTEPWCRACTPLAAVSKRTSARLSRVSPPPPVQAPVAAVRPAPPVESALPPPQAGERRRRRLRQEFAVRVTVTSLLLLFNEAVASDHAMSSIIRLTAFIGLVLNVPYYLAIRTVWRCARRRTCACSWT